MSTDDPRVKAETSGRIEKLYKVCQVGEFENKCLCRNGGWTIFQCVDPTIGQDTFISITLGQLLCKKLKNDLGETFQLVCSYFDNVMLEIKEIVDSKLMMQLDVNLNKDYDTDNVVTSFYMIIFDKIASCFKLNEYLRKQVDAFFHQFFLAKRECTNASVSIDQFRVIFENLNLVDLTKTIPEGNDDYSDIILGRIAWFIHKIAVDIIRVSVDASAFVEGNYIGPFKFTGQDSFEELKRLDMFYALSYFDFDYTGIFPLPEMDDETPLSGKSFDEINRMIQLDSRVRLPLKVLINSYHEYNRMLNDRCQEAQKKLTHIKCKCLIQK